ncbi:MAG TPA: ChbG/HpnK family deacetylase [Polyangiaceae bacterium]|jgi:predicted glycoside hydrolase/deacetylase ChbG (UPF0249 family)|nr:ChbG/HpnK family deacetylase [Polyangiaceae bacterium]
MTTNSILAALGLPASTRAVVLHADDIGMCHATVEAYQRLVASRPDLCASTMVTCSWFPAVARACRASTLDMGVHLTLTSEWRDYRWGPLTGTGGAGLCDSSGYFPAAADPLYAGPRLDELIAIELEAQVQRALDAGIDVTHVDSHMFSLMHPSLLKTYVEVGHRHALPCFLTPKAAALLPSSAAVPPGGVRFDAWATLPLDTASDRLELAKRCFDKLPEGLSYFLFHPAIDTPELRALAPDWQARVADFELCAGTAWEKLVASAGLVVVGMRALRAAAFPEPDTGQGLTRPHRASLGS